MRSNAKIQISKWKMWITPVSTLPLGKELEESMAKTINIYLNNEDRKLADNLKVKYRLSLTTIVDVITKITFKYFLWKEDKEQLKRLFNDYIYTKGKKTSIKEPNAFGKNEKEYGNLWKLGNIYRENLSKSRFITNCLMIYLHKEIKNYIKIEHVEKYWNEINKELLTRQDNFWDYNAYVRKQRRMLRENKEYFKKALEEKT